jgi:putative nucleotidyltransferase with HDIG domain
MSETVEIQELRVGMFVHLDLGWWAHPFALSSFLVTTPEQVTTLRGLGLKKLRWSPEKSRLDGTPADVSAPVAGTAAVTGAAQPATDPATDPAANPAANPVANPVASAPHAVAVTDPGVETATPPAAADAVSCARAEAPPAATPSDTSAAAGAACAPQTLRPRSALATQRAAQQLCEQQYAEAGTAWTEAQRLVPRQPEQALAVTEGLTRALLDKLMVDREMCVRVLNDVGGDRVAGHALNVTVISLLMARVFGFAEPDLMDMGMGALLHDVGKLDLPDRVRFGESHLSPSEMKQYRDHVALGVAHGRRMGLSEGAMTVLAQHHELVDGSGFPGRLNVDRMSTAARIVSLVNRYDNLCNPPQAAQSLTPHEALSLIFAQTRTKFDATMLNAFIRMMGVYPPGSVVQLTDDRYASVVSVNSSRPLKPRVLVCDTRIPVHEATLLNLDGLADIGIRRSLKPAQLPAAVRDYLSPRPRMVYFFEPVPAAAAHAAEELAA